MLPQRQTIYIGGSWRESESGNSFAINDPATLETVGACADGGVESAGDAVEAAVRAFPEWSDTPVEQRGQALCRLADLIERDAAVFESLLVTESGKPLRDARGEVASCGAYLKWNAEEARRCYGRVIDSSRPGVRMWTIRQPVGVVAAITPWNYPLNTLCRKLAPALAAGCTLVVKPAPETPLSSVELLRRMEEAGFPPGVVNLVTTAHAEDVVSVWLADARVRKIAFTGSTEVGKRLFRGAADTLKRMSLELGGHAPVLVFRDADLERAAEAIVASRFRHAGQTCVCAQRVYVEEDVAEPLGTALRRRIASLRVGNGRDPGAEIGPLIHEEALRRVTGHVDDALQKGAVVRTGGTRLRLADPNRGCFYHPTLIDGVRPGMRIMDEETFGPVLTISRFRDEEEAVIQANSTPYGLVAYAFTKDLGRAFRLTERLHFGTVGINDTQVVAPQLPFGGTRQSGQGKENGVEGIEEYLETKSAVVRIA